jgi:hypothetical protein
MELIIMNSTSVSIPLDDEASQIYTSVSIEQQQKLQRFVNLLVREIESKPDALLALMDDISTKAEAQGLTPEILEDLLDEESPTYSPRY